jgi:dolichol-phosphate mannosyltransferase
MRVLVGIPVYNEERHVARVVAQAHRYVEDILIVDDGSTDRTGDILSETPGVVILRHPENRGYGQSLIDAFQYACRHRYDWLITLDSDDQHEPARIPAFIERASQDDVDVVSGSRYLVDLPGNTPAPEDRRRINTRITPMLNRILGLSLTDAFCGFKEYRVEAVARLPLTVAGYAFPMQFWAQAAVQGLRIRELPVPLIYNDPNRSFGAELDDPGTRLRHYIDVFIESYRAATSTRRLAAG